MKTFNISSANKPLADRHCGAQVDFDRAARAAGFDPENKWIGGYVDYEWEHLRPLMAAYDLDLYGRNVMEFGCNVGASSIVIGALGADVTGIDVDMQMIAIAQANVDRHNAINVDIRHVPDTRQQPFKTGSFDFVIANSVLEYVAPSQLHAVIAEIARVLKPQGQLFICGTASRISPREIHSRRWLVNYMPLWCDRLIGKDLQRGLCPFLLSSALDKHFEDMSGDLWAQGRQAIHGELSAPVKMFLAVTRMLGIRPGLAAPNMELLLRSR